MGSNKKDNPTITLPKSSGIKKIRALALEYMEKNATGLNFGIVVEISRDGKKFYDFYPRMNQPCYGELRKYKKSHADYTDPKDANGASDDYRPGDLYHPFPDGRPIMIVVGHPSGHLKEDNPAIDLVFGKDSPWKSGVGSRFSTVFGTKNTLLVFEDMEIDSTVFVSALNNFKSVYRNERLEKMISLGVDPKIAFLLVYSTTEGPISYDDYAEYMKDLKAGAVKTVLSFHCSRGYYLPVHMDVARFLDADPLMLTGGTMGDRYDYNRRRLQDVFLDESVGEVESYPTKSSAYTRLDMAVDKVIRSFENTERQLSNTSLVSALSEAILNLADEQRSSRNTALAA